MDTQPQSSGSSGAFNPIAVIMGGLNIMDTRTDGVARQLDALCLYAEMPRACKDSDGIALNAGDLVSGGTLGNKYMKVLEVGWRWVRLSKASDTPDGPELSERPKKFSKWYELTIAKNQWKKL